MAHFRLWFNLAWKFQSPSMGSQHPSPNVKTLCNFEPQIWPEMITSCDAGSTCFKGSRTSCREIIFGIFWPNFGQKRSHHMMDASCRFHAGAIQSLMGSSWYLLMAYHAVDHVKNVRALSDGILPHVVQCCTLDWHFAMKLESRSLWCSSAGCAYWKSQAWPSEFPLKNMGLVGGSLEFSSISLKNFKIWNFWL